MVTTDDAEIASVARAFGAETPFLRPAELADDYTGTNEVTAHALEWLAAHGTEVSLACCLYPTAPLITDRDLRDGYELLISSGKSFVFTASRFSFPIQRAIRIAVDDGVAPFFPQWIDCRSQDLEEAYHDAGAFYWGRADAFRNGLPIFASQSSAIVLPRFRVQDIDTVEDWEHAERLHAALRTRDRPQPSA
jgi:pseudaminic acid cytidylyltransferase